MKTVELDGKQFVTLATATKMLDTRHRTLRHAIRRGYLSATQIDQNEFLIELGELERFRTEQFESDGMKASQLARRYKITRARVYQAIKEDGIKPIGKQNLRTDVYDPDELDQVAQRRGWVAIS